jgi:hypothetical protein
MLVCNAKEAGAESEDDALTCKSKDRVPSGPNAGKILGENPTWGDGNNCNDCAKEPKVA